MWRSYEYTRYQGMIGMQGFWNDYFGPTMRELTMQDGVFWYDNTSKQPPAEVLL